ncbi:hypothetical protein OS493_010743 [Desmophyllum pertusum]|uniref:Apple domain-containing protein n=1 Tax=Desmophyllum pertusum TaxID=174260 RepID=A0A9W9ZSG6_9CNID|nr:hypothetical protein OS493_010743 [Desmophyllum pertusum]
MEKRLILGFVLLANLLAPPCLLANKLQYFTFEDRYLPGHIFKSLRTSDWSQCLQACSMSERCVSYSFDKRKPSENCDLHVCGFLNECNALDFLIASQDSVFQQLRPGESSIQQHLPQD